ncbi:hypothetical protein Pmani_025503 [Petrolisthes manimaculis]|uniref:Uncharacterized protein n=1 Tax=Petrolisthes manimaculis TaxID=1843537 RepID=A0AAE1TYU9_9EUCA|nr:hypothetical protein Pmani_025503 [Petrolisthes manimaculis]
MLSSYSPNISPSFFHPHSPLISAYLSDPTHHSILITLPLTPLLPNSPHHSPTHSHTHPTTPPLIPLLPNSPHHSSTHHTTPYTHRRICQSVLHATHLTSPHPPQATRATH